MAFIVYPITSSIFVTSALWKPVYKMHIYWIPQKMHLLAKCELKKTCCCSHTLVVLVIVISPHACEAAVLVIYTGKGGTPEVNLRECISHMPPLSAN